jgi:hypothetical protein
MTTAAELDARTECTDLRRALEAERTCNRNHLAHIARLNALTVAQAAEIDRLMIALQLAEERLADARTGIVEPPY